MSEPKEQTTPAQTGSTPTKKSSIGKYLMFTIIGVTVIGGLGFGVMYFLKSNSDTAEKATQPAPEVSTPSTDSTQHAGDDTNFSELTEEELLSLEDTSGFMDEIERNLQMLEFGAESDLQLDDEPRTMSKADSITAADWLVKEQAKLTAREEALNKRQQELEKLERSVAQKITRIEQVESARIANLAKMYDNMDPAAVARLAANLDDATVVAIIPRMKQRNASQLLSLLPPQRAASLSKQMITIAEQ